MYMSISPDSNLLNIFSASLALASVWHSAQACPELEVSSPLPFQQLQPDQDHVGGGLSQVDDDNGNIVDVDNNHVDDIF